MRTLRSLLALVLYVGTGAAFACVQCWTFDVCGPSEPGWTNCRVACPEPAGSCVCAQGGLRCTNGFRGSGEPFASGLPLSPAALPTAYLDVTRPEAFDVQATPVTSGAFKVVPAAACRLEARVDGGYVMDCGQRIPVTEPIRFAIDRTVALQVAESEPTLGLALYYLDRIVNSDGLSAEGIQIVIPEVEPARARARILGQENALGRTDRVQLRSARFGVATSVPGSEGLPSRLEVAVLPLDRSARRGAILELVSSGQKGVFAVSRWRFE